MINADLHAVLGEPFDFEWFVHEHGYKVDEADKDERQAAARINRRPITQGRRDMEPQHEIVAKGGALRPYRPFATHPGLFLEFAGCEETPAAAADFASRHGLLGLDRRDETDDFPESESFGRWSRQRSNMAWIVEKILTRQKSDEPVSDLYGEFNRCCKIGANLRLDATHGRKLRLVVVPFSLIGAMWLQLAHQILGNVNFRQCRMCASWFPYGPGQKFRSTRAFCSDRCRVAWSRLSKGEQS